MSQNQIRVLIVEDHQVVADGLSALLNDQPDIIVVGSVASVVDSVARAEELRPDVALVDFRLVDGTGADAGLGIRSVRPDTKLIFLTREDSDAARFAAFEAGASAFTTSREQRPRWWMQSARSRPAARCSPRARSRRC